jgi:2-oxoglutarate ferredoxin oxidoreductase subunit gamma
MSMKVQDGLYEELVIAGFGGQGIILVGKLLAQAAMRTGIEVTFMPSYGAEVRGGTANCAVVLSNRPIPCPVVGRPHTVIAMNNASISRFAPKIRSGGLLMFNSSLAEGEPQVAEDIEVVGVPADEIAAELDSPKSANMVILGAYLQKRGVLSPDDAAQALADVLASRHHSLLATNAKAIQRGAEFILSRA